MVYHILVDDFFDYQQFYLENERQSILKLVEIGRFIYLAHREVLIYMLKILWFTKDELKDYIAEIVKYTHVNSDTDIETD